MIFLLEDCDDSNNTGRVTELVNFKALCHYT